MFLKPPPPHQNTAKNKTNMYCVFINYKCCTNEWTEDDEIADNVATCWEIALSAAGKLVLNCRIVVRE